MLYAPFFCLCSFFLLLSGDHRDLHSFPTRRSSDLVGLQCPPGRRGRHLLHRFLRRGRGAELRAQQPEEDRKSTRLNSSHVAISYAVFCLKKKRTKTTKTITRKTSIKGAVGEMTATN